MEDAPMSSPDLQDSNNFGLPSGNPYTSLFDEEFRLCDFLNVEPDEALWLQNIEPVQAEDGLEGLSLTIPALNPLNEESSTSSVPDGFQMIQHEECKPEDATPKAQQIQSSKIRNSTFNTTEWDDIYQVVIQLFLENSLMQMLGLIPERIGLRPSRKQLKTKIKSWRDSGLLPRKNIDKGDMNYMVLIAHLNKEKHNVETFFTYHGFPVPEKKLQRHRDRWGIQHMQIDDQKSPHYISWTIPLASDASNLADAPSVGSTIPLGLDQALYNPQTASSVTEIMEESNVASNTVAEPAVMHDSKMNSLHNSDGIGQNYFHDSIEICSAYNNSAIEADSCMEHNDITMDSPSGSKPIVTFRPSDHPLRLTVASVDRLDLGLGAGHAAFECHDVNPPCDIDTEYTSMTMAQLIREAQYTFLDLAEIDPNLVQTRDAHSIASRRAAAIREMRNTDTWRTILRRFQDLLCEHSNSLFVIQQCNCGPSLRKENEWVCLILGVLWHRGCYLIMELLRRHITESLPNMKIFVSAAFRILKRLYNMTLYSGNDFAQLLGDLARYRMAFGSKDKKEWETWRTHARYWYDLLGPRDPQMGSSSHSLAIPAGSDHLWHIFDLYRSLPREHSFPLRRKTILAFLEDSLSSVQSDRTFLAHFFLVHLYLYQKHDGDAEQGTWDLLRSMEDSESYRSGLLSLSSEEVERCTLMSIASILNHGNETSQDGFELSNNYPSTTYSKNYGFRRHSEVLSKSQERDTIDQSDLPIKTQLLFWIFNTVKDSQRPVLVMSLFHIVIEFIASLVGIRRQSMAEPHRQGILIQIPWAQICEHLNETYSDRICWPGTNPFWKNCDGMIPLSLDEDDLLLEMPWTKYYFPEWWFDKRTGEDVVAHSPKSIHLTRMSRILWLVKRLRFSGYLSYENGVFEASSKDSQKSLVAYNGLEFDDPDQWQTDFNPSRNDSVGMCRLDIDRLSGTTLEGYTVPQQTSTHSLFPPPLLSLKAFEPSPNLVPENESNRSTQIFGEPTAPLRRKILKPASRLSVGTPRLSNMV